MNNIIYEYVPSENIAKVDINDFETLLEIKDSYEKLIRKVPDNVLQQRIDKAIEYCNETIKYMELLEEGDANIQTIKEVIDILKGSEE